MPKDKPPAIPAVRETILTRADEYFDSIIDAIDHSRESVDMEVYIFQNDAVGQRILNALSDAAARGVAVRLLIDGMGASPETIAFSKQLKNQGGQLKIYHPVPWYLYQWSLSVNPVRGLRKLFFLLNYVNRRNHRKTVIVDGQTIWLGSYNVTQQHLSRQYGGDDWRDTGIKISPLSDPVPILAFDKSWNGWKPKVDHADPAIKSRCFLVNFSRRLRRQHRKHVLRQLGQSRQRVWITNAYFSPDRKILKAMKIAARRGVDVRLLLPLDSDVVFMPWAATYFYGSLINAGVRIFEYQNGILHAKTMLVDDWAMIGSSNLNGRSAHLDLEIDYILQQSQSRKTLEQDFINDLTHSIELNQRDLTFKKRWRRILGFLTLFFLGRWL